MRPEEGLPVSSERILCFVSCGSPRWFSSTGTPFSLFYSSTSTCCEPVRATMKSSSPTVRATPGGRGTSSPPSASRTLSCTPAPKRASWRCGLGAGRRGAARSGAVWGAARPLCPLRGTGSDPRLPLLTPTASVLPAQPCPRRDADITHLSSAARSHAGSRLSDSPARSRLFRTR